MGSRRTGQCVYKTFVSAVCTLSCWPLPLKCLSPGSHVACCSSVPKWRWGRYPCALGGVLSHPSGKMAQWPWMWSCCRLRGTHFSLFLWKLLCRDPAVSLGFSPLLLTTCLVVSLQALTAFSPKSSHCTVLTSCTEWRVSLFGLL